MPFQPLPQFAHGVFIDGGKWGEVGDADMFVNLVQAAADRAKFDGCRATFGEEAGVRGTAAGIVIKTGAAVAGHCTT